RDMTVVAAVAPTGHQTVTKEDGTQVLLPTFDAWIEAWTPGDTLAARVTADKQPYDLWVKDGYLNAADGPRIRFDIVAARVAELGSQYDIKAIAYDNYAFSAFKDEL